MVCVCVTLPFLFKSTKLAPMDAQMRSPSQCLNSSIPENGIKQRNSSCCFTEHLIGKIFCFWEKMA